MKKVIVTILILSLSLISLPLFAASMSSGGGTSALTSNVTAVNLEGKSHVVIVNDGDGEVYLQLNMGDAVVATNSGFYVKANEDIAFTTEDVNEVQMLCAQGETATVRYIAWD